MPEDIIPVLNLITCPRPALVPMTPYPAVGAMELGLPLTGTPGSPEAITEFRIPDAQHYCDLGAS